MKTIGIIGGIGPESTIDYYRSMVAEYRRAHADTGYPAIVINSVDLDRLRQYFDTGNLDAVTDYLLVELQRLADAGADFALLAANTPHIVFDRLQQASPVPLLSIVQATCDRARAAGVTRAGLLGTRFTMQAEFYPRVFSKAGSAIVVPTAAEQDFIHEKYFDELVNGVFLPETREALLAIIERMKAQDRIDGIILGGTELPLILGDSTVEGVALLDTTKIHVKAALAAAES